MSVADILEMKMLYEDGWHISQLARRYNVHSSVIAPYIKNITRKTIIKPPIDLKTYEDYLKEDEDRRERMRLKCNHKHIAIICTKCGQHFEETKSRPAAAKVTFL